MDRKIQVQERRRRKKNKKPSAALNEKRRQMRGNLHSNPSSLNPPIFHLRPPSLNIWMI